MLIRLASRLGLPRESLEKVASQQRRNHSARDFSSDLATNKVVLPRHKVAVLCYLAMTDEKLVQWIREQPWLAILEAIAGTELLKKILDSAVQPESPGSIATFLASLEQTEAAALSQILKETKPIDETVRPKYWTDFALDELRSRKQRLESVLRLSENSADEHSQSLAEIKEVLDLESHITHISRLPSRAS
jgi:hypothetical protein